MYQGIQNLMCQADMFGADITLNIQKRGKFTSFFGGFMSVVVWCVMLYVFISQGLDLINRVDQQAITRTINDISPQARILNVSNFMIGIKIDDPLQTIYNTTNYTMHNITIVQNKVITFPNKTREKKQNTSIIMEQCTSEHFSSMNFVSDPDSVGSFSDYLCLPLNYSITLEGTYNSQIFQYTSIKITTCKNQSHCFNSSQLSTLPEKQAFRLSTLMFTTIINPFSNEAIISQQLFQDFYQQTKKLQEQVSDIFLEPNSLEIDKSVFPFQQDFSFGEYWSFRLGNVRSFINDYSDPTNYFTINLRVSSEYFSSFIYYAKFGDFISFIGGTLKIITSLIGIIVIKYNTMGFKMMLASTLYQCKIDDDTETKKKAEKTDIFKFIQKEKEKAEAMQQKFRGSTKKLFQFNKVTGVFKSQRMTIVHKSDTELLKDINQNQQIKDLDSVKLEPPTCHENFSIEHLKDVFIQNMIEQLLLANQKIKLGFNFVVYYLSCLRHFRKYQKLFTVLEKSASHINNDLDIVLILQKLQEVNKLKTLLLSKQQLHLFNYLPQPIITWNGNTGKDSHYTKDGLEKLNVVGKVQRFDSRNKILKLFRAFEIIQQDDQEINKRLIESLGPLVSEVFQQSHKIAQDYNNMRQEEEKNRPILNQNKIINTKDSKDFVKAITIRNYLSSKEDVLDQGDAFFDI